MLVKSNAEREQQIVEELVAEDENLMLQHKIFEAEMVFKQELIDARKKNSLTQAELGKLSGLSQQAISRMERGEGCTLETIIRYLSSMGYSLSIRKTA